MKPGALLLLTMPALERALRPDIRNREHRFRCFIYLSQDGKRTYANLLYFCPPCCLSRSPAPSLLLPSVCHLPPFPSAHRKCRILLSKRACVLSLSILLAIRCPRQVSLPESERARERESDRPFPWLAILPIADVSRSARTRCGMISFCMLIDGSLYTNRRNTIYQGTCWA